MSWYTSMKIFQNNLKLVMNKYFCKWHESFPGVDPYSNDMKFSGMSKYISYLNSISIKFSIFTYVFSQMIYKIMMNLFV